MQNNELYTEPSSDELQQQEEVDLGTFKSVKTLKEAYDCLRKTFTQNAMELAKYKKNEQSNNANEKSQELENADKTSENSEKSAKNDEKTQISTQNSDVERNLGNNEDDKSSDKVEATPDKNTIEVDKGLTPSSTRFEGEKWQEEVKNFFVENEDARQYASEIGRIIMQNENVRNSADPLDKAWIKVLQNSTKTATSETDLEVFVMQNESIKQKIIEEYLNKLQHSKTAPKVIAERSGAQVNAQKTPHALTMAEAKELAKKIMIK